MRVMTLLTGGCLLGGLPAPHQATAQDAPLHGSWVAVAGSSGGQPIPVASLPLLRMAFAESGGSWTLPGFPRDFTYRDYGATAPDSLDLHFAAAEPERWVIPARSRLSGDTLQMALPVAGPFDPERGAAPARPASLDPGKPSPVLRLTLVRADGRSSSAVPSPAALDSGEMAASEAVDVASIEGWTRALVAPGMEGRASGQPGGQRAARTIAGWFAEAGLEPAGDDGYVQSIPFLAGRATSESWLEVGGQRFHAGADFTLTGMFMRTRVAFRDTAEAEVVLFGPSLASAGPGEELPDLDVDGKIVAWMIASGPSDGSASDMMRTYEALHRSGAAAVIAVLPGPTPQELMESPLFSGVAVLDEDLYGPAGRCPMVLLGPATFSALFGDGREVGVFMGALAEAGTVIQPTGKRATLSCDVAETTAAPTSNVVGVIRGSDPDLRDEAVVFTAHHDALGSRNGATWEGAADNALGVAEMVAVARAIGEAGVRPRRSLVFVATAAEERGMLGSLYWTRHPTWPLQRVVADLNMDGGDAEAWGPLHGAIDLTREPALASVAAEVAAAMGFPVIPNESPPSGSSSDFYDFQAAGIPAIQLMGLGGDPARFHERITRFSGQRLHQPGDRIDPEWDWTGTRQMAQLYLLLGLRVANAEAPPAS